MTFGIWYVPFFNRTSGGGGGGLRSRLHVTKRRKARGLLGVILHGHWSLVPDRYLTLDKRQGRNLTPI